MVKGRRKSVRIPKEVDKALKQRTKYAQKLQVECAIIDDFLIKHDIDAGSENYLTGCEIYTNPLSAEMACRDAILEMNEQEYE